MGNPLFGQPSGHTVGPITMTSRGAIWKGTNYLVKDYPDGPPIPAPQQVTRNISESQLMQLWVIARNLGAQGTGNPPSGLMLHGQKDSSGSLYDNPGDSVANTLFEQYRDNPYLTDSQVLAEAFILYTMPSSSLAALGLATEMAFLTSTTTPGSPNYVPPKS